MSDLLNQIRIISFSDEIISWSLFTLIAISMFSILVLSWDEDKNKKLTTVLIRILLFLLFAISFNSFDTYKHNKIKSAIDNKEYTLKINGGILELNSDSPYLESKQFKIIYQDDSKIQVEYNSTYYNIDKSQEKIDAANWRPS